METTLTREEVISWINNNARDILNDYYTKHDPDNFFRIDQILKVCYKQGYTVEDVPTLIEMQNVIVIG